MKYWIGPVLFVAIVVAAVLFGARPRAAHRTLQWETSGGIRITALDGVCLYESPPGAYGVRGITAVPVRDLPAGAGCE